MRDNKQTLLFALSTIVVVALFFVIGYFVTRSTDRAAKSSEALKANLPQTTPKKDLAGAKLGDSLLVQYETAMSGFDNSLDSVVSKNTGNPGFDAKLLEYYKLRREISGLLKNNDNIDDINIAKEKIALLQEKIEELRNRNIVVEADNIRLSAIIRSLTGTQKATTAANTSTAIPVAASAKQIKAPANESNLFVASDVRLNTIAPNRDEFTPEDVEDKIQGSFLVKNNMSILNAELHIVVQKPNGEIVKNSAWDAGVFYTKGGQRKVYSLLLKFDYNREETKRCNFSINADDFQKGNYLLQVYHKGVLIANASKRIS